MSKAIKDMIIRDYKARMEGFNDAALISLRGVKGIDTTKLRKLMCDKKIKLDDLKIGDPLSVEAQFDPEHTFDAINVRIDTKKPSTPAQDSGPIKFSN